MEALEILDSRGRPTSRSRCASGTAAPGRPACRRARPPAAGRPSNAATGTRPATAGWGCWARSARSAARSPPCCARRDWRGPGRDRRRPDRARRHAGQVPAGRERDRGSLDGLRPRARHAAGRPLWDWLTPAGVTPRLPVPHFNVVNGGRARAESARLPGVHGRPAGRAVVPGGGAGRRRGVRDAARPAGRPGPCHRTGRRGRVRPAAGQPGGCAGRCWTTAITDAGYTAGPDGVAIALDPAASEFCGEDGLLPRGRGDADQRAT